MKCTNCNSCMRVVRLDDGNVSKIFYVCGFCEKVLEKSFGFGNTKEITDEYLKGIIVVEFRRLYGKALI